MPVPCKTKVLALGFSSDGQVVRVVENGLLRNVEVASGKILGQHKFKKGEIARGAVSRDGKRIAVGSETRLLLLDADSGELIAEHKEHAKRRVSSVQWTRDGRLLVVSCVRFLGGQSSAAVFDSAGKELHRLALADDLHAGRAALCGELLHFESEGSLVACGLDGTVRARVPVNGADRLVETPRGTLVLSESQPSLSLFSAALGKPTTIGTFATLRHLEPVGDTAIVVVARVDLAVLDDHAIRLGLDGKTQGELALPAYETVDAVAGSRGGVIAAVVQRELRLS